MAPRRKGAALKPDTTWLRSSSPADNMPYVISRGRSLLSGKSGPGSLCRDQPHEWDLSCFKLGDYPQARRYLTQYLGLTADNPFPDARSMPSEPSLTPTVTMPGLRIFSERFQPDPLPDIMQGAQLYPDNGPRLRRRIPCRHRLRESRALDIDPKVTGTALSLLCHPRADPRGQRAIFLGRQATPRNSPHASPTLRTPPPLREYLAAAYYNERKYGEGPQEHRLSVAALGRTSRHKTEKPCTNRGVEQLSPT